MLTNLTLKNWRSHRETHLEFAKGTNALVGIMGSGKTSVLDAICYALYGTFPRLSRREVRLEEVLSFGSREAEVILNFKNNGNEFKVRRKILEKKTDAEIYRDGKLIEKGQGAVSRYITSLLKVDYELFTRAIYSEQNRIDYLLTLSSARRKEEIDRLLGLDRFELAHANAVTLFNKIQRMRKELEAAYDEIRAAELGRRKKEFEKKLREIKEEQEKLALHLKEKEREISEKRKEVERLSAVRKEHIRLWEERAKSSGALSNLRMQIEKYPGLREEEAEKERIALSSLEKEIGEKKAELKSLSSELTKISSILGSLDSKIKLAFARKEQSREIEAKLREVLGGLSHEELRKRMEYSESQLRKCERKISILKNKLAELEAELSELREGITKCPLCESALTENKLLSLRREKKKKMEEVRRESENLSAEAEKISLEFKELAERSRTADLLEENLKQLRKEILLIPSLESEKRNSEAKFNEMSSRRNALEAETESLEKKMQRMREALSEFARFQKMKREAEELAQRISELDAKLGLLRFDEDEFEKAQAALRDLEVAERSGRIKAEMLSKEASGTQELLEMVNAEFFALEETKNSIAFYSEKEQEIAVYKNCIAETQIAIRNELIGAVNSAFTEIWPLIYPYADYKMVRMRADPKDYHFEIFSDEWRNLDAVASGGERACFSLALRIAFAMVLTPNLSWFILDEPTHNLDREAVRVLAETLEEKIPKIVEQTFVITHDTTLLESRFATVYKFERDKERNESTVVEKIL